MGASGHVKGKYANRLCKFLGDISYPIYIIHYPLIYIYTAWVHDNKVSLRNGWPFGSLVLISAIMIAYVCLKFYDEPIRSWLRKKLLSKDI
jgi:peptidoglycan/LPS O-acetylase OafA/YrhL